ncbi:MAG: hypothetical protein WD669_12590 [Pirellulales bacterium]
MSTATDAAALQQELTLLAQRVDAVERHLGLEACAAPASEIATLLPAVRQITQEIFPGECEFTDEFDPEAPGDRYMVVNVQATGDLKEIAERGCLWDERVRRLSDRLFGKLRLLISPR